MQSIKIETPFKGLYTNAIDKDISYSYFADTDKVKVTKQYLESEEYRQNPWTLIIRNENNALLDIPLEQYIQGAVLDTKVVFMDDDKFWYVEKQNQYQPDLWKHLLVVTDSYIYLFKFDNDFLQLVKEQGYRGTRSQGEFVKALEYQGNIVIILTNGMIMLGYKRINGVRTLVYDLPIAPRVEKNLTVESVENITVTSQFKIQVRFQVVSNFIFLSNSSLQGMQRYRISSGISTPYPTYSVTAYIVTFYQPPYDFSNAGQYDYDATSTFLFVPIAEVDGKIKVGVVKSDYNTLKEKYFSQSGVFFSQQSFEYVVNGVSKGYFDRNWPHAYNLEDMSALEFTKNLTADFFPEVYNTYGFDLQSFLDWTGTANIEYKGIMTVSNTTYGFDTETNPEMKFATVIQTAVFNGQQEVIIGYGTATDTGGASQSLYKTNIATTLFSSFVTSYKLYIGFGVKPQSFELAKIWDVAKGETLSETYLGYSDLTGVQLSNVLAVYGNIDQFEYITGGDDYITINSIGFMIQGNTVYYSANDTSNLVFYRNRYIPNIYGDALISIGGMLGVIRYNKDVTLISIQVIENELYFKVYDTVSFVIKDKYSYLEIPDGVLMSLKEGLYLSTPQERQLLSEPINDIFESGNVSKLLYDDYNRRIMAQSGDDTYVFDLINKVWIKHKGLKLKNIAFDGTDVITIDGSSFAKVVLSNETEGEITFHKVNLGSNKITKRLIGLRIDLEGTLTTFKNSFGHYGAVNALNGQPDRRIEEFYIPISDQLPEVGLDFTIKFKGKIYGIEVLYDVIGEFVNTKFLEN